MRRADIWIENKGCGDRWKIYLQSVLPSCWPSIVSSLEKQGETVLVTASPGRSGLGKYIYQTAKEA